MILKCGVFEAMDNGLFLFIIATLTLYLMYYFYQVLFHPYSIYPRPLERDTPRNQSCIFLTLFKICQKKIAQGPFCREPNYHFEHSEFSLLFGCYALYGNRQNAEFPAEYLKGSRFQICKSYVIIPADFLWQQLFTKPSIKKLLTWAD